MNGAKPTSAFPKPFGFRGVSIRPVKPPLQQLNVYPVAYSSHIVFALSCWGTDSSSSDSEGREGGYSKQGDDNRSELVKHAAGKAQ